MTSFAEKNHVQNLVDDTCHKNICIMGIAGLPSSSSSHEWVSYEGWVDRTLGVTTPPTRMLARHITRDYEPFLGGEIPT